MQNTVKQDKLDPKWLQPAKNFIMTDEEVMIKFRNGKEFATTTGGCKALMKEHGPIAECSKEGKRVSVHLAFSPTNEAQRVFLSIKTGVKVQGPLIFTFATRAKAQQIHKEIRAIGIETNNSNWPVVLKEHTYSVEEIKQDKLPF